MKSKAIAIISLLALGVGLIFVGVWLLNNSPTVTNFADCKAAGYPIQESYPEVCVAKNGDRFTNPDQSAKQGLLQVCPDEWIEDRMPGPNRKSPNQYFIIDHQRVETTNYDIDWIKFNCPIKQPQIVY